jgi:dihydrofolate synthase / folylpolyglutamate synthase
MPDHARSDAPAVQAQLDRLAALSPGRDTLGLERITALLDRLHNPQHRLPPVFHVAGTNGKGSTCAFLRAMLEAAGHTVHVYTSPHLVRFNERIRLSGRLISDADLAAYLARVLDVAEGLQASFFEVTTAAAFLAFAEHPADACVIEVGLGGRLDATNVIQRPLVCGIASLGIDHKEFLLAPENGTPADPFARIAFEKAGIAKPGVPLVTLDYAAEATASIAAVAAQAGAQVVARNRQWTSRQIGRGFVYSDTQGKLYGDPPALPGAHQLRNAALAIAMLRHQPLLSVSETAINRGIATARWPGRLQLLSTGPLSALLGPKATIWLDGGHNPDAGAALAAAFPPDAKLHLICGMLANKDALGFLRPLASRMASFNALPIHGHAHHDPKDLCWRVQEQLGIVWLYPTGSVETALAKIADEDANATVLICGSLYLAGEALRANNELPD